MKRVNITDFNFNFLKNKKKNLFLIIFLRNEGKRYPQEFVFVVGGGGAIFYTRKGKDPKIP